MYDYASDQRCSLLIGPPLAVDLQVLTVLAVVTQIVAIPDLAEFIIILVECFEYTPDEETSEEREKRDGDANDPRQNLDDDTHGNLLDVGYVVTNINE